MTDYKDRALKVLKKFESIKTILEYPYWNIIKNTKELMLWSVWYNSQGKTALKLDVINTINKVKPMAFNHLDTLLTEQKLIGMVKITAKRDGKHWATTVELTDKSLPFIENMINNCAQRLEEEHNQKHEEEGGAVVYT